MQVNRYLKDKTMDHIDHALGRPVNPVIESYRNYFAVDHASEEAAAFRLSDHWLEGERWPCGMTFFHVSDDGRGALAKHLRDIGDLHREYLVSFGGFTSSVIGTSPSNARYEHWLSVSDGLDDLTFGEFIRRCRVRVAQPLSQGGEGND